MIFLLTGVPGSGKSYYAVNKIHKLKDRSKVLHNVDGLKIGTSLDEYCHSNNLDPLTLFTPGFHDKDTFFRGWLFVIDECQAFFPKSFRNEVVQRFFQLHRHYGIDIVLLSQDYKLVCPSISLLAEFQLRAVSDIANPLPGTFMYRKMVGFEAIGKTFLRKKKSVFALYKTADFDQKEVRKKSRPMLIIFCLCAVCVVYAMWRLYLFRSNGVHAPVGSVSSTERPKGPLTPLEKKKLFSSSSVPRSLSQPSYSGYQDVVYPPSLEIHFSGRLYPISHITDSRHGTSIPFLGVLFHESDFPYPVVHSLTGLVALLPADVYEFATHYQSSLPDPNPDTYNSAPSGFSSSGVSRTAHAVPSDRGGEGV